MSVQPPLLTGPYKGLVPYSEDDATFFFGRDTDCKIITANLLGSRLTLLYGVSGVGKSSLLRAGVAYRLRQLARKNRDSQFGSGSPELAVTVFDAWRDNPLTGVLANVRDVVKEALNGDEDLPEPDLNDFCGTLNCWAQRLDGELLIILDQFEEYFRYSSRAHDDFANELVRAVNRTDLQVNFLISIREDALASLDRFKGRITTLFENYLRLDHLDSRSARQAMVKPLEAWKRLTAPGPNEIDDELVEEVLRQLLSYRPLPIYTWSHASDSASGEGKIAASALQVVMVRLWQEGKSTDINYLSLTILRKLGNMDTIFEDYLASRLRYFSGFKLEICARIFRHLILPGGIRVTASSNELSELEEINPDRVESVLNKLTSIGVLTVNSRKNEDRRYEVPYDILGFAVLRWRQRFDTNRRVKRKRLLALGSPALLLAFALIAFFWYQVATRHERLATAERLAAKALSYSNRQLDLSLLLAVQASRNGDSGDVRDGLLSTIQKAPRLKAFLYGGRNGIRVLVFDPNSTKLAAGTADGLIQFWDMATTRATGAPLRAHANRTRVTGLVFSAGGTQMVTAGKDGALYQWDLAQPRFHKLIEPKQLERNNTGFASLTISREGLLLAASSTNGTVSLWDFEHHSHVLLEPSAGKDPVVTLTPNGKLLAVGGQDGIIRLYQPSGRLDALLRGDSTSIRSIAVDPLGRWLAAGTQSGNLRLWSLTDRKPVGEPIHAHSGGVWSLAFAPYGRRLASGGADQQVNLWSWNEEKSRFEIDGAPLSGGHVAGIRSLAFSSDGHTLASGGDDGRVCLWSLDEGTFPGKRLDSGEVKIADEAENVHEIESMAASPDGRLLVTGGSDHIRLWDFARKSIVGEIHVAGAVSSVAFSPDSSTVAFGVLMKDAAQSDKRGFATSTGRVLLWRIRDSKPYLIEPTGRGVEDLAFSPNGNILTWADLDWSVRLWNHQRFTKTLNGHKSGVWAVAFSSDGESLASGSADTTVRLWDPIEGKPFGPPLAKHSEGVAAVAYSPDSKMLASGGLDGRILLWDLQHQQLIGPLFGSHPGGVSDIAFSPDGAILASCGQDKRVRLWSPFTRQPVGNALGEHNGEVKTVAFRPDGHNLASGGSEGHLFLWDVDLDSWISRACAMANRNLSLDEWRQFVDAEAPYEKTCPDLPIGEGVLSGGQAR